MDGRGRTCGGWMRRARAVSQPPKLGRAPTDRRTGGSLRATPATSVLQLRVFGRNSPHSACGAMHLASLCVLSLSLSRARARAATTLLLHRFHFTPVLPTTYMDLSSLLPFRPHTLALSLFLPIAFLHPLSYSLPPRYPLCSGCSGH